MLVLAIISAAILFYFLPSIICIGRSHLNAPAIFMTNLLLGWTGIGWIAALIWSFTNHPAPVAARHPMKLLKLILALTILLALLVISTAVHTRTPHNNTAAAPVTAPSVVRMGVPVPADELLGKQ